MEKEEINYIQTGVTTYTGRRCEHCSQWVVGYHYCSSIEPIVTTFTTTADIEVNEKLDRIIALLEEHDECSIEISVEDRGECEEISLSDDEYILRHRLELIEDLRGEIKAMAEVIEDRDGYIIQLVETIDGQEKEIEVSENYIRHLADVLDKMHEEIERLKDCLAKVIGMMKNVSIGHASMCPAHVQGKCHCGYYAIMELQGKEKN